MKRNLWCWTGVSLLALAASLAACGGQSASDEPPVPRAAAAPSSGTPAVVTHGRDGAIIWVAYNDYAVVGEETLFALISTDPAFAASMWCDGLPWEVGEGALPLSYQEVWTASQRYMAAYWGEVLTKVYRAVLPEVFDGAFVCRLLRGEDGALLAEGTSRFHMTQPSNNCQLGPGRDLLLYRAVGALGAPSCSSGTARFQMGFVYQLAMDAELGPGCEILDPADVLAVRVRGPELTCIGR